MESAVPSCLILNNFELLNTILHQNIRIIEHIISNNHITFSFNTDIYHNLIAIENSLVFYLYVITKFCPELKVDIEKSLKTVYKYRIRYSNYCCK